MGLFQNIIAKCLKSAVCDKMNEQYKITLSSTVFIKHVGFWGWGGVKPSVFSTCSPTFTRRLVYILNWKTIHLYIHINCSCVKKLLLSKTSTICESKWGRKASGCTAAWWNSTSGTLWWCTVYDGSTGNPTKLFSTISVFLCAKLYYVVFMIW